MRVADDCPIRLIDEEVLWWGKVKEGSGINWFSFVRDIEIGSERINLLPLLTSRWTARNNAPSC